MKIRMMSTVVIALAIVASSAGLVHAGGGGAGVPLGGFVADCYLINGANPPHVLSVDDQFFPLGRTEVALRQAKLLCTPATAEVTSGHDVRGGFEAADHLKCYEVAPRNDAPNEKVQVADTFGNEVVKVGVPRFVCVGAFKCAVGEECPPAP